MKSHVQVAVIGGGVVGCGVLYHLTRLGWRDVMLIERSELTSGPSRRLRFGVLTVQLRHAPRWQMVAPHRPAGDAVRALAWLGPREVDTGLEAIMPKLSAEDFGELAAARAILPIWMAEPLSALIAHG